MKTKRLGAVTIEKFSVEIPTGSELVGVSVGGVAVNIPQAGSAIEVEVKSVR